MHPVQRITIPEIRQDEWFLKDLPSYLIEPVEEFLNTGVDAMKPIDPRQLAPGKPREEAEQLHEAVVSKLGRTMGYAKDDVKDALRKEEPSAIKDAYLIVRENQLMLNARKYSSLLNLDKLLTRSAQYTADNPQLELFLASSPPGGDNYAMSPMAQRLQQEEVKPLTPSKGTSETPRTVRTMSDTPSVLREEERPRISNVRVLNTSLHHVHQELMQIRDKAKARGEDPDLALHPAQNEESTVPIPEEVKDNQGNPIFRSKEEQEATSRALKPHSRSVTNMADLKAVLKPEALTPVPSDEKKASSKKVRRWQFGIRSRNQPYEAMKCLYGALKEIGAEWEIIPASAADISADGEEVDANPLPPELEPGEHYTILQSKYSSLPTDYYIPREAWNIKARILKKGLLMPGEGTSVSANSSAVSLPNEAKQQMKKHMEELSGYASEEVARILGVQHAKFSVQSEASTRPNSGAGDHGHDAFTGPAPALSKDDSVTNLHRKPPNDHIGVWVFVDIQLYTLEANVYVVDFKCDGYQNVVWHDQRRDRDQTKSPQSHSAVTSPTASRPTSGFDNPSSQSGTGSEDSQDSAGYWVPLSQRFHKEKEISSSYPFLDVASDLVAQLASQPT